MPFIKINCAAMPSELVESELFGYKKGSFTGATVDRQGLLELAANGSLLLDEIGEMLAYLQTENYLRVLQEREDCPLGSQRDRPGGTFGSADGDQHRHRARAAGEPVCGKFLYRINTVIIQVPPLRDAEGGHPAAVRALSRQVPAAIPEGRRDNLAGSRCLVDGALVARQRAGARERGRAGGAPVQRERDRERQSARVAAPPQRRPGRLGLSRPRRTLAEIEKTAIVQTLHRTNWNKTEAADALGLYRPTLYSKIKKVRDCRRGGPCTSRRPFPSMLTRPRPR